MEYANNNNSLHRSDIKILVVDDREDNLFSIEAILEKDHYNIVKASSGRAALKILLQEHDFSLILMDVQMPDLNGFETATIIYERDKLKNIPIIFITAHNYDEDLIFKSYKLGAVDYIYKPINPELLRVKVGVFVELYRKNYQLLLHEKKLWKKKLGKESGLFRRPIVRSAQELSLMFAHEDPGPNVLAKLNNVLSCRQWLRPAAPSIRVDNLCHAF